MLEDEGGFGFDAAASECTDLSVREFIDFVKVVRAALLNAVSLAGLLLTASCAVAERAPITNFKRLS